MKIWLSFTKGILKENPVLVLMIGLCPALAVSSTVRDAFGMGIAATFVLVCSNIVISLLRRAVPHQMRIPIFIVIISTFVTIVDYVMAAYSPSIHHALGVFIPLIVVNCIILGRAEAFAYKNPVLHSTMDGLGMGIGFTLIIVLMGAIRELLGNGTILGSPVLGSGFEPALIMILPPGAFLTIGFMMAIKKKIWGEK
ncbi:electron transport complex subunit RsxE [Candidatus Desantisbacteria bacterium CG1_02_38_46]|uniref:Ion-translocating oxidoreductase complex subunit E n=3 Tax=unclassified Candidatus Desantisiibacteriota TaxID=3106372 RepID=A0A2H9PBV5_9BACT|nr:MAG: electron transport complex subunit RsxE [Candidatus Desantisbacteria bacterium CG1_02_38_46]PIU51231.1 MAG: electron transport complex subunit RsxE [Candidatus Desantisbacteria bacterium CG07_land_8_20_14_0_80_39_15]PIZ16506.1 MAG: electron transport complex subunit RsxE [Candidatus Desantisbacteria bacterium CG_4_10_14_0_8_um_filter_39_17]